MVLLELKPIFNIVNALYRRAINLMTIQESLRKESWSITKNSTCESKQRRKRHKFSKMHLQKKKQTERRSFVRKKDLVNYQPHSEVHLSLPSYTMTSSVSLEG